MTDRLNEMKLSFIIPVLNGEKCLGDCLGHIMAEKAPDDEIILVDNGSTDNTLKIAREHGGVRILERPQETIAAMRNQGVAQSSGDLLAFIDSDVLVGKGWREAVLLALSDESIKATGSICGIPDSATWIERAWWSFGRQAARRVNFINTGNLIVRREAFEEIGGFDERLISDEDSDIGSRLNQRRYWILDDPNIRTVHLGNAKTLGAFILKEKWHSTSIVDVLTAGTLDKPMMMTFLFMFCILISLLILPLAFYYPVVFLLIAAMMLAIPTATSAFRGIQYRNPRFFLHLSVLYFVFYSVRSVTVLEVTWRKMTGSVE